MLHTCSGASIHFHSVSFKKSLYSNTKLNKLNIRCIQYVNKHVIMQLLLNDNLNIYVNEVVCKLHTPNTPQCGLS